MASRTMAEAWLDALVPDTRPWQRSLRRDRPPRDRRMVIGGLVVGLVITVLELVGFGIGMRHRPQPETRSAIRVDLISPATPLPPIPPEPVPPVFEARVHKVKVAPPETRIRVPPKPAAGQDSRLRARIGSAGTGALHLFKSDGSVELPKPAAAAPSTPTAAGEARWAEIRQRGDNPLDCKRTRFAANWKLDESLGSKVARKYLGWIGLYDPTDTRRRAQRAAEGCDP
jgi:hypothetical protein